jgi:hypothetical protein
MFTCIPDHAKAGLHGGILEPVTWAVASKRNEGYMPEHFFVNTA